MSPKQMDPISYTAQAAVVFQHLGQSSEQSDSPTCIDVAITCSSVKCQGRYIPRQPRTERKSSSSSS